MTSKYQLMPAMTPAQYSELKDDIKRRGVLVPIEFDGEGNILDGHHRYQAFTELIEEGADLPLYDKIVRRFSSEEEKVAYVVSLNVKRRHLNAEQRQELVVRLRKEFGYTLSKIAQILGISIATASRDIDSLPKEEREELKSMLFKVPTAVLTTHAPGVKSHVHSAQAYNSFVRCRTLLSTKRLLA